MVVGIELARAMEPLTFFQMKVFNAQLAIRYKGATRLRFRHFQPRRTFCGHVPGNWRHGPGNSVAGKFPKRGLKCYLGGLGALKISRTRAEERSAKK
jgi:hypothetical protein